MPLPVYTQLGASIGSTPAAQAPIDPELLAAKQRAQSLAARTSGPQPSYVPQNGPTGARPASAFNSDGSARSLEMWNGQKQSEIAGTIGTALATGSSIGGMSTPDYLQNQMAKGTPLGALAGNAQNGAREAAIQGAGAADVGAYRTGSQELASGLTGQQAFAGTKQALGTLAGAGQGGMDQGMRATNQAGQVAAGMSQDIAGLRSAAAGTVPSAAMIQQQQGIGSAINSQASMAAGARGGNLAASMRGAQAAGAGIQAQGIGQNAALRANEMATARGQLSQATGIQGQTFNQAGQVSTGLANTDVSRANAGVIGNGNVANGVLGSQITGLNGQFNAGVNAQGRTDAAIAQDQADQDALNNHLMNLANIGGGNAATIAGQNTAARTAANAQLLQTIGSTAKGFGDFSAGYALTK